MAAYERKRQREAWSSPSPFQNAAKARAGSKNWQTSHSKSKTIASAEPRPLKRFHCTKIRDREKVENFLSKFRLQIFESSWFSKKAETCMWRGLHRSNDSALFHACFGAGCWRQHWQKPYPPVDSRLVQRRGDLLFWKWELNDMYYEF